MLQKVPFGKTGLQVSQLGFGAAPAAYLSTDEQQEVDTINRLLDAGMNVLDTAASYPGSELFLGKHFAARRKDYVLVSKCGSKIPESDAPAWSAALIEASVDRSLRQLKTDVIDVMLLHSCDLKTLQKGVALAALVDARKAGKIRFAGYSGDNEAVAWAAEHPEVAVIEMSVNFVDQVNLDQALPHARTSNVGVIAKRPIANAAWKDISQQPGMYKSYAAEYTKRFAQLKLTPADLGFGNVPPDQAWPEIALRFTLSFPGVHTAIIGTTNPKHAEANLRYVQNGPLRPEVVEKIRSAYREADPNGEWKGQT
jgi:aryl-alcohol dehydrogenase-like predicted oxidoreductase